MPNSSHSLVLELLSWRSIATTSSLFPVIADDINSSGR